MDQFSFPASAGDSAAHQRPTPRFTRAPPLWLLLEAAAGAEDPPACLRRNSCSAADDAVLASDMDDSGRDIYGKAGTIRGGLLGGTRRLGSRSPARSDDGLEEVLRNEDRMDRIWESFNEELRRISCDKTRGGAKKDPDGAPASRKDRALEVCYGDAGGAVKRRAGSGKSGSGSRAEKSRTQSQNQSQSLQAMLKILKKMVLVQKSNSMSRKASGKGNPKDSYNKVNNIDMDGKVMRSHV